MSNKLTPELEKAIEKAVTKVVNGKIDALTEKLDQHMDDIEPFMAGWKGSKIIANSVKWVAGFIIAVSAAIFAVINVIKLFK